MVWGSRALCGLLLVLMSELVMPVLVSDVSRIVIRVMFFIVLSCLIEDFLVNWLSRFWYVRFMFLVVLGLNFFIRFVLMVLGYSALIVMLSVLIFLEIDLYRLLMVCLLIM